MICGLRDRDFTYIVQKVITPWAIKIMVDTSNVLIAICFGTSGIPETGTFDKWHEVVNISRIELDTEM